MTRTGKAQPAAQTRASVWLPLLLLLFFVSGALALVYQVIWTRMMIEIFGSTALAVGTVLAAFMSGLAAGSWALGRLSDRRPDCLRLYALLELGIAVAALGSHLLLDWMTTAYPEIYRVFGSSAATFATVRFVLAFLLVMAPTVLMGGTLPVLARLLALQRHRIGASLSTLYAVNTFGAVAGVLLTGFVLIGRFGIHAPLYGAIVGNGLIGAAAFLLSRRGVRMQQPGMEPPGSEACSPAAPQPLPRGIHRLALVGLGLSGFTSFAYEVYWTRSLVFILGNSTYALTTMLSAFLTGIAVGGWLIRYPLARAIDRAALFGWIQVLLGVCSALALPLLFLLFDP
ncbi:MAG: fused MFS/spermidine synthase, partial [Lysobacterales bacterium]